MRPAPTAPHLTAALPTGVLAAVPAQPEPAAPVPALVDVVPDLVEGSAVVEELATVVEVELVTRGPVDLSLAEELDEAEQLVVELDREVHGAELAGVDDRSDEQLVLAARAGDDGALSSLLTKYRAFARLKARSYFLVGADREDIVQEGMIGLYKAVRDFNPDMDSSFRAFAELCVTRQVITAIKTATRHKHGPLNNYVSFSRPVAVDDDGERLLGDVLPMPSASDPADLVISAERIRALQAHVDEVLSDLETEVLRLYVEGKSYAEIADRLQRHVKSIDNALQRIKRKLECHLRERALADAG